jgi:hypothetical protein
MKAPTAVREKLEILGSLYQQGYQSDVIERTLDKLIDLERERVEREYAELTARLLSFEHQYGMPTEDFYRKFEAGELGDSVDFVEWSSMRDLRESLRNHLAWLTQGQP